MAAQKTPFIHSTSGFPPRYVLDVMGQITYPKGKILFFHIE